MKSARTTPRVIDTLAELYPGADTELHYRTAFELLVATMLSAQSTDARVNMVTPALFAHYPDAHALAKAALPELEQEILSTGFFRQKAKALVGMAQILVAEHGGTVPASMDVLTALPGVGRKTANVVLGHALGVPGLPVDRHVLRVSNRIGIAEGDDPVAVESQLSRPPAQGPVDRWPPTSSSCTAVACAVPSLLATCAPFATTARYYAAASDGRASGRLEAGTADDPRGAAPPAKSRSAPACSRHAEGRHAARARRR